MTISMETPRLSLEEFFSINYIETKNQSNSLADDTYYMKLEMTFTG
jgi:hypothetical protein